MIFHSKLPEGIYKILHMPSSSLLGQITRSEFLSYEIFQVQVSTRRLHGENQMQKQQNESQFQLLLEKLGVATPPRFQWVPVVGREGPGIKSDEKPACTGMCVCVCFLKLLTPKGLPKMTDFVGVGDPSF